MKWWEWIIFVAVWGLIPTCYVMRAWQNHQSKQRTFCYCKNCHNELCGDPLTQCFDAGSEVHYICSKCRWQTDFLFDAPVPIFLRAYAPEAERQAKGEQ